MSTGRYRGGRPFIAGFMSQDDPGTGPSPHPREQWVGGGGAGGNKKMPERHQVRFRTPNQGFNRLMQNIKEIKAEAGYRTERTLQ